MPQEIERAHPEAWQTFLADIQALGIHRRLFISYAWYLEAQENARLQRWLETLRDDLRAAGFRVFLDLSHLDGQLNQAMTREIQACDAALVIGTPRYVERVSDSTTPAALELEALLACAQMGTMALLPLLWAGDFTIAFPHSLRAYLIRDLREGSAYVHQMMTLSNPLGILPSLLGVRIGDTDYEAAVARYRLNTLTQLPPENRDFTGREAQLDTLMGQFQILGQQGITPSQTITGLGGMGKTQLALAYAYRHRRNYQFCYWLSSDTQQVIQSLRALAIEVGVNPDGLTEAAWVRSLYAHLAIYESWLLIFDNAADPRGLTPYLPPNQTAQQHVLITSRNEHWRDRLPLDVLTEAEGMAYLEFRLRTHSLERGPDLLRNLGYLPLALSQAAAYLEETALSIQEYLNRLSQAPLEVLGRRGTEEGLYPQTVATTWLVSLDQLRANDSAAIPLLMALSYLASDDIPRALCKVFLRENAMLDEALRQLRRYSLISPGVQEGTIKIHRLVQLITQHALAQGIFANHTRLAGLPYTTLGFLNALKETIERYYPWKKRTEADFILIRGLLPHLDVLIEHLNILTVAGHDDQSQLRIIQAHLLVVLGDTREALGDAARATESFELALAIKERYYGQDHVEVSRILTYLGETYRALGRLSEARASLMRALTIKERHYGQNHPEVAITLVYLGIVVRVLGEHPQAIEFLSRALEIQEGQDHPDYTEVARTLTNLANAWGGSGDVVMKAALLNRALPIQAQYYGPNHPELAITLLSLGNAYGSLGNKVRKRSLLEQALAINEQHFGQDHVQVAKVLSNLWDVYNLRDRDDAIRAKNCLERALRIFEGAYGRDHPLLRSTLDALGYVCSSLGDWIILRNSLEQLLAIEERVPDNYSHVLRTLRNLANVYQTLGNQDRARSLLERAQVIEEQHAEPGHPEMENTLGSRRS